MNTRIFASATLLSLLLFACSSPDEPQPFASADDLAARLEADTGVKWTINRQSEGQTGAILLLGPEKPVALPGASREETTRAFFERYGASLPELGPKDGLGTMTDERDSDGTGVVRLAHVVPGTPHPLFDVVSSIHFDASGAVVFVDPGTKVSLDGIAREPGIDAASARKTADEARSACPATEGVAVAVGALPLGAGAAKLAYRFMFDGAGESCEAEEVFVDATARTVLLRRPRNASLLDRGYGGAHYLRGDANDVKPLLVSQASDYSFVLVDSSNGPRVTTSRTDESGRTSIVSTRTLGTWGDIDRGVSVDAHFHVTKALEYFRVVHGRAGLDGRNGPISVFTNDSTGVNAKWANASFSTVDQSIRFSPARFRQDTNRLFQPLSLSYDVVVHELAHGVLAHTSKLTYWNESGAINESFADVMGTSAEHWLPEKKGTGDFIIGRESSPDGLGMRDMANPTRIEYRQAPDYPSRSCQPGIKPNEKNDFCWVHTDSGIGNRAFVLMTAGGHTGTAGVAHGLGFQATRYIWWQSVVHAGDPNLTWRKLAIAQGYVAHAMGFDTFAAVSCAWAGVGVISRAEADPTGNLCAPSPAQWSGSTCAGVDEGYVCSDVNLPTAYYCRRGSIAGGKYCADLSKKCAHAANGWRGSVDGSGALRCE